MPKRVGVKTAYDFVAGVIPYQSLIFNLPSFLSTMIIQFCPKDDSSSRLLLLPLCIDLGLQRTDHSRPPLISVLNYCSFFILFIFFHLPFSFFFFSHISIWAHFWFSSSSSGENLFFSIFGPDLLRLSMQSLAHYLFPSSSSLRSLLKLRCPPATPPQGAVIMHPSLLVNKDKTPLFLYTLFNSNLSNLRNSIRFAFFPISPVILLLVSLFDAPQSSFTP